MSEDILHIDPTEYETFVGFLHVCCDGCENEYDGSNSKDLERFCKCLSCIDNKLGPAYRNRGPFDFNRKTGKIITKT